MKNKCLSAIVSVLMMVGIPAVIFAQPIDMLSASEDATEILDLEEELLEKINYGAARGEIKSDELIDSVDFDAAYKVYGNSELFEARIPTTIHTYL